MDEDSDEERESALKKQQAKQAITPEKPADKMPMAPNPANVIIRKDYDPKAPKPQQQAKNTPELFVSPLTGELISAASMTEHMRISMLDPRWLEQKEKEKKDRQEHEDVLATGANIEKNLKRLAEFRSDMFGKGAEETVIGRRKGKVGLNWNIILFIAEYSEYKSM